MPTRRKQGGQTPPHWLSLLSKCPPLGPRDWGGESLRLRRSAEGRWERYLSRGWWAGPWGAGTPSGAAAATRLVPPPLVITSCREESWPGMERWTWQWTAALGNREGYDWGAPAWGQKKTGDPTEPGQGKSPWPSSTMFRTEPPPLRWPTPVLTS